MPEALRVCCYDRPTMEREMPLRAPFEGVRNLLIVGEAESWDELREWLRHGQLDVVAVNLDVDSDGGFEVVKRIAEFAPGCSIIGVSKNTDPHYIISAVRTGCTQFVTWPIDETDLNSALDRVRTTRTTVSSKNDSKRICVIGSSGGAGATTLACNLAMELAHLSDRRSALVDLNLEFGDVACAFDCNPTYTVADICADQTNLDRTLLDKALFELPCNLSLLARPNKIEHARQVTPEGVHEMLEVLGTMFSYVVVDLPRTFSFLSTAAVENADRLLLVTQLGVPFIRNATRIYECLLQMGASENAIEIVVNRCTSHHGRITQSEVEEHFGRPVFAMIPNDYQQVQSALDLGHPIVTDAPASETRLAIQKMARTIANVKPEEEDSGGNGESSGFLRRFLKGASKPAS